MRFRGGFISFGFVRLARIIVLDLDSKAFYNIL